MNHCQCHLVVHAGKDLSGETVQKIDISLLGSWWVCRKQGTRPTRGVGGLREAVASCWVHGHVLACDFVLNSGPYIELSLYWTLSWLWLMVLSELRALCLGNGLILTDGFMFEQWLYAGLKART